MGRKQTLTVDEVIESMNKKSEKAKEMIKYLRQAYEAYLKGADPNDFPYHGWKYHNAVEAYIARIEQRRASQNKRNARIKAILEQAAKQEKATKTTAE